MSYTKGQLVDAALTEIGIADYDFDYSPEERVTGLRRLDSMMAEWNARGIMLGYPTTNSPDAPNSDDDSNIPDWSVEAVLTNLAIRLAPSYGKAVLPDSKANAKRALNTIFARITSPNKMQLPEMPKGAGYKARYYPFTPVPQENGLPAVDENFYISGEPE
jgi:hypothetical protein